MKLKESLTIPKISAISKEAFYKEYVYKNKPVVITGLVDDWSALRIWNVDYFKSKYGTSTVQAYQLNRKGECDIDTSKGSATQAANLGECLSTFDFPVLQTRWSVAASKDLFPAQINKEFKPPLYCADGKFLRSMIFVGPTGVVSPLHQDLPENLYVMVNGVKRITLFKPSDSVYPNSRLSNLPNHSQIDAERPNFEKFPKLINSQPYIVDLKAGETLFIPSFWWHHLRNLEPSFAVNFWWSQGWKLPIAWAASLYKKWRAI